MTSFDKSTTIKKQIVIHVSRFVACFTPVYGSHRISMINMI